MNKVFLIRNVAKDAFGGGEVYQLNLAKMLKKYGFEPVILTNSRELIKRAKETGYKVLVPPYIKRQNWSGVRNLLLPVYVLKINKLKKWYEKVFEKERPEVVNIESRDDFIAGTLAAKKCGVRVIWTDHADFKNWVLQNVNVRFKNMIGKVIVDLTDEVEKVIFVSQVVYDDTVKMINPLKIRNAEVIENGVFDEYANYREVRARKASFVFVGRVVEEKGISELLDAFSMVQRSYLDVVLNIYGDGEISRYKDKASGSVVFHGKTKEPLRALAENEIFVLPSHREGLSLSLIEAAMMKKTIIASDVDGNPEVVDDKISGLLVPVKDAKELAEAMKKVLAEPKLVREFAMNARKKFEKEYDFEKIFAKKMLPLYNNKKEEK